MSIHIATINGLNFLPDDYRAAKDREDMTRRIASDLVAGTTDGLDLTCEKDVIFYLIHDLAYLSKVVREHIEAATSLAMETIVAASVGLR